MPAFEVTVAIKKDGVDLAGFPYRRTIETAEGTDFNVTKAGSDGAGVYSAFPGLIVGKAVQLFVASSDQAINLIPGALAAKDGILALLAGGLILLINVNEAAGAGDQIEINNLGTPVANIKGAWGST